MPLGDYHIGLTKKADGLYLTTSTSPPRNYHRPSVDVLFESIATIKNIGGFAVILTGMGEDGVNGIKRLRDQGFYTLGQDKGSCVIYGMSRVASERGGIEVLARPNQIGKLISEFIEDEPESGGLGAGKKAS